MDRKMGEEAEDEPKANKPEKKEEQVVRLWGFGPSSQAAAEPYAFQCYRLVGL